jgi:protocatechuate 3,4-dioxygenase beta subunit
MRNREIAATLGLSVRAVEDNLRKGREALAQKATAGSLLAAAPLLATAWSDPPGRLLPDLLRIVERGPAIAAGSAAASAPVSLTASSVASFSGALATRWTAAAIAALVLGSVAALVALMDPTPNPEEERAVSPPVVATEDAEGADTSKRPVEPGEGPEPGRADGMTLRGRVLDAFGNPVAKAEVRLVADPDENVEQADDSGAGGKALEERVTLSPDGTFSISGVAPGRHTLIASHEAWGEIRQELQAVEKDRATDLRFEARSEVTGEIRGVKNPDDLETFNRHAEVRIDGPLTDLRKPSPFDECRSVVLDAFSFRVGELGPGLYRLVGSLPFGVVFEEIIEIAKNGDQLELVIDLKERLPRNFRGRAFVGDRDHPLANALLHARVSSHGSNATLSSTGVRTDAEGYFSCESRRLVTGSLIRLERSKDLPSTSVEYLSPPGEDDEYEVVFPERASRKAIIRTRDGRPVPNVEVSFQRFAPPPRTQWKMTDLDGEIDISGVDPGPYRVRIGVANGALPPAGAVRSHRYPGYRLEVDGSAEDLVIEVDPGRFLALGVSGLGERVHNFGKVRMPDGTEAPVAPSSVVEKRWTDILNGSFTARVTIREAGGPPQVSFHSPVQGPHTQYRRRGLEPGEQFPLFTLIGIPDGASVSIELLGSGIGWGTARVSASELDTSPLVEVRVGEAPREVEVRVFDAGGRPVDDAQFLVPGFTEKFRKDLVLASSRSWGDAPQLSAEHGERINPIIGLIAKPEFKVKGHEEDPGRFPGEAFFPYARVLRVGPGTYRLLVYAGDDFPIRVSSPTAGARVIHGSELVADPTVVLE